MLQPREWPVMGDDCLAPPGGAAELESNPVADGHTRDRLPPELDKRQASSSTPWRGGHGVEPGCGSVGLAAQKGRNIQVVHIAADGLLGLARRGLFLRGYRGPAVDGRPIQIPVVAAAAHHGGSLLTALG